MKVQWSHCVLNVRDLEVMAAFYCDAFGFEIADRGTVGADTDIIFLSGSSTDHHQLGLATGRSDDQATSLSHMAFRVESIDDVKRMVEWVSADNRIRNGAPLTHGNAISVYFSDPEGNGVEVFCDTPWHVQQPVVEPWDPSHSTEEVLATLQEQFQSAPGFMPMEQYRAERAQTFGEN